MNTEFLYQIFLIVLIIVGLFLIVAIIRLIEVLNDIKNVTAIASKRTTQIDNQIEKIFNSLRGFKELSKGFIYSFDVIRTIRKKFFDKKGEVDE